MIVNATLLLPIVVLGLVFLIPVRIRPGIVFGVSVPVDFATGREGQKILRGYRVRGAIASLIALAAGVALLRQGNPAMLGFVLAGQLACNVINWVLAVRKTRRYAVEPPLIRTASLDTKTSVGTEWMIYIVQTLPLVLAAIYLSVHWRQIPLRFPIHWGIDGAPNGWAIRDVSGVYGSLLVGACSVCFLMLLRWLLQRSPGSPERRAFISRFLVAIAACVSVTTAFLSLLPLLHTAGTRGMRVGLMVSIFALIAVELIFVFLLVKMQVRQGKTGEPYDGMPDKCWYGGQIYYNPQDRAIFVEKRFGIGYTLNFARPASWVFMAVVLGIAVLPLLHLIGQ